MKTTVDLKQILLSSFEKQILLARLHKEKKKKKQSFWPHFFWCVVAFQTEISQDGGRVMQKESTKRLL